MTYCIGLEHYTQEYRVRYPQVNDSIPEYPLGYDPMESRGTRIKAKRLQRGFSQLKLADALGVTKATVSKWEAAERPEDDVSMDPAVFFHLCQILIIEPERLLYGDSMRPPSTPGRRSPPSSKAPVKP